MNKLIIFVVTLLLVVLASAEFSLFEEEFYSIDLLAAKCRAPRWRGEGLTCGGHENEANYTSTCYIQGLFCNSTGSDNHCRKIVSFGKACVANHECSIYSCLGGKCYSVLGYGESCSHNDQCFSKWCMNGVCAANMTDQACSTNNDCKFFNGDQLYCHSGNKTCEAAGKLGAVCSAAEPCESSLSCVKPGSSNEGVCKARATAGQDCHVFGQNDKPQCAQGNCVDGKCVDYLSGTDGSKCVSGSDCAENLACNKTSTEPFGLCRPQAQVKCDVSTGASLCNPKGGYCSCPNGPEMDGVCATDTSAPTYVCASESAALENCKNTKCNFGGRGTSFFYGANHCWATSCENERNAYNCCLKSKFSGWVPTPDFTDKECEVKEPSKPPATDSGSASTLIISTAVVVASAFALLA